MLVQYDAVSSWAIEQVCRAGQVDGRQVRGTFSSKEIKFERGGMLTLGFLRTLESHLRMRSSTTGTDRQVSATQQDEQDDHGEAPGARRTTRQDKHEQHQE